MQCVLDQYVQEVDDFSSQYGSDGSISYVAFNLVGKPSLYPDYGDFSAAFCMRSYGEWWSNCPSAPVPIKDRQSLLPPSVDFVDIRFESGVSPIRVDIYETYHPGSVVRVWGSLEGNDWTLLWAGEPKPEPQQARIFSPPIAQPDKLINLLRLEFDQRCQDYYSALDAVLLVGSRHTSTHPALMFNDGNSLSARIMNLGFHNNMVSEEEILSSIQFILSEENMQIFSEDVSINTECKNKDSKYGKLVEEKQERHIENNKEKQESLKCASAEDGTSGGYFDLLPDELLFYILKLLDLRSLCRLSHTCKLLKKFAIDPFLYMKLNLKNCWWLVTNSSLSSLVPRCSMLQELDLSWCGTYGAVDTETFMEFVHQCGHQLTILRVNNCHFMDNYCLYIIANVCLNLTELSMGNCTKVDQLGFCELKKCWALNRLDLSRTRIDFHTLQLLLQHATNLQHLNLNNCGQLDMDDVCLTLATFSRGLVSLQAWKTHGLTTRGLRALACISTIEDLDLGWALSGVITEGLGELVRGCHHLKRLYMTALRTLTDHDLSQLSGTAHNLQQLDLMGTRNITPDAVYKLLQKCPKLQLLDISFCEQIHSSFVNQWKSQFPSISIKGGLKHQVRVI